MPPSSSEQDENDVKRVRAGDHSAFRGIVERWQRPLVSLAFRFCRHHGRAEEMAQDAFLRAFRSLHQWRGDAAFSTWLFAVSLNVFRSEMRRSPVAEEPLGDTPRAAGGPGPEDAVLTRENEELVRRTVATLPPKYRDALILFYFLDQDVAQAAGCLGVPAGTLKARLHRGRDLLKTRLARRLTDWRGTT